MSLPLFLSVRVEGGTAERLLDVSIFLLPLHLLTYLLSSK